MTTPYAVLPKLRMKASACKSVTHVLVGAAKFHVCAYCVAHAALVKQEMQPFLLHHGNDNPGHGKFQTELSCMHPFNVM